MKSKFLFMFLGIFSLVLAGCVTILVPVPTPTAIDFSTLASQTRSPAALSTPTKVSSAPICSVDPIVDLCPPPTPEILGQSCDNNVPYTLVGLPVNSTYELMDSGAGCRNEGVSNDQLQVSCTGGQLDSYLLKVCDPACTAKPLDQNSGRCSDGYGYSPDADCCWPVSDLEAGCVLYRVDIGACP